MNTTVTHATVAAQPGWFLAVFTNSDGIDGVRCEQIIAWEIQRVTSPKGLVTRFPIPITAESKNTDLDCTIWGIKRPDGKFVFPVGANEGMSEEKLSRLVHLMEEAKETPADTDRDHFDRKLMAALLPPDQNPDWISERPP